MLGVDIATDIVNVLDFVAFIAAKRHDRLKPPVLKIGHIEHAAKATKCSHAWKQTQLCATTGKVGARTALNT